MHLGEAVSCKDHKTQRCDQQICGAKIFFNVYIHRHLYRCLPPLPLSLCVTQFSSLCAVSGGCPVRGIHHPPYAVCKALVKTSLRFFFASIFITLVIFSAFGASGGPSSSSSAGQRASMERVKSNSVWQSWQIWKRRPFKNIVLAGGDVSCRDPCSQCLPESGSGFFFCERMKH